MLYVCVKIMITFEVHFVLGYSVRFVGDGVICIPSFSRSEMFISYYSIVK